MLLSGVSLAASALLLPMSAQTSYARAPLAPIEITGTIPPEPTATAIAPTPAPPTPTQAVPGPTPVPESTPPPDNSVPSTGIADPFVTLSGCAACLPPGEVAEFAIDVGNNGTLDAVNVQVYQKLPPHFELVDVTATRGTVIKGAGEYTVDLGTVTPRERIAITLKVRLKADHTGEALNAVILRTTSTGDLTTNNTGFARCQTCAVVLPVTGAESAQDSTPATLLMLLGSSLILMSTLARRKRAA
jgi:uncharacterized repeat protein (TIGR01451 family)